MPHPGDSVKITTEKDTLEGILLPSFEKGVILIKLKNGYNIGFTEKEIKKMEVLQGREQNEEDGKNEKKKEKQIETKKSYDFPTIAILHTGGTIASKVDYRTGGVATAFSPAELISLFP